MNSKGNTGVWSCGNMWMEDVISDRIKDGAVMKSIKVAS